MLFFCPTCIRSLSWDKGFEIGRIPPCKIITNLSEPVNISPLPVGAVLNLSVGAHGGMLQEEGPCLSGSGKLFFGALLTHGG